MAGAELITKSGRVVTSGRVCVGKTATDGAVAGTRKRAARTRTTAGSNCAIEAANSAILSRLVDVIAAVTHGWPIHAPIGFTPLSTITLRLRLALHNVSLPYSFSPPF